jgi:hypothetical protein
MVRGGINDEAYIPKIHEPHSRVAIGGLEQTSILFGYYSRHTTSNSHFPSKSTTSGNMAAPKKRLPSERWTSYDDWNYGGMKQRLQTFMSSINKAAITEHASAVLDAPTSMSKPFSAGQHWCCFELVAADDESRFLIARVRLPKHPESSISAPDEADEYLIQCEVATMKLLHAKVTAVPIPRLYAYEAPGSARAIAAGAAYMLIEGFHGNSLQDVNLNIYNLPVSPRHPPPLAGLRC